MISNTNIGSGGNQLRGHAGHAGRGSGNMTVGTLADQLLLLEHHMGMVFSKEGEQAALISGEPALLLFLPDSAFLKSYSSPCSAASSSAVSSSFSSSAASALAAASAAAWASSASWAAASSSERILIFPLWSS